MGIKNENGVAHPQCHPRRLKEKLEQALNHHKFTKLTKRKRVLLWLIESTKCNCQVTRFDAEWVSDHIFNTTCSEIQRLDGIEIQREQTKIPGRFGEIDCKKYWLSADSILKANKLLGIEA